MKPKRPKPRNPMARALHSGAFKPRTVPDKRKTRKTLKRTLQDSLRTTDDDLKS